MGHLYQIDHKYLVGNGLSKCHRELEVCLLELAAVDDALHRHHLWLGIRYFNTYGAFAWNGGNDAYAECRKREGYVILEVANLGDAYARRWSYLV